MGLQQESLIYSHQTFISERHPLAIDVNQEWSLFTPSSSSWNDEEPDRIKKQRQKPSKTDENPNDPIQSFRKGLVPLPLLDGKGDHITIIIQCGLISIYINLFSYVLFIRNEEDGYLFRYGCYLRVLFVWRTAQPTSDGLSKLSVIHSLWRSASQYISVLLLAIEKERLKDINTGVIYLH